MPITYTYQWKRVDPGTLVETPIAGETTANHVITTADLGQKLKVTVTADNGSGTSSADTASVGPVTSLISLLAGRKWRNRIITAVVTAAIFAGGGVIYNTQHPGGGGGGGSTSNCFASPGACGYPDPAFNTVGVPTGTSLTASGSITTATVGQIINAQDVTGSITVATNNVTIKNSRVTYSGGSGAFAIHINTGVTGTIIQDTEVRGAGSNDPNVIEAAVWNGYGGSLTLTRVYFHLCSDCVEGAATTVNDSYMIDDGLSAGAHYELVYINDSTVNVNHSTLLNPNPQTAVLFGDTNLGAGGAADNHMTLTNSLVGGGGYMFYPASGGTSVGTSSVNVSNNRFARCTGTPVNNGSTGGQDCAITTTGANFTQPAAWATVSVTVASTTAMFNGQRVYVYGGGFYVVSSISDSTHVVLKNAGEASNQAAGTTIASGSQFVGQDHNGYLPRGGYFGPDAWSYCGANSSQIWSGNVWDDNGATVPC